MTNSGMRQPCWQVHRAMQQPRAPLTSSASAAYCCAAGDIAGEDDFWGNLTSYARFFVTVMLGTVNVVLEPFRKVRRKHCIKFCVIVRHRTRNACRQARHQLKGSGNVGLSKIALLSTRGQSQSHDASYLTMHSSSSLAGGQATGHGGGAGVWRSGLISLHDGDGQIDVGDW